MFSNSKNLVFTGQPSFNHYESNYIVGAGAEPLDEGIRLLLPHVIKGSMHNSGERYNAPSCHPETRLAIQEDILGWAGEPVHDFNRLITWLHGPAGAGKSAIAQTIAQKLHARGQLAASFFFSRVRDTGGKGDELGFVPTLAFQISQNIPATRPHIGAAVRKNPLIFHLGLEDQVDALIVAPLNKIFDARFSSGRPKVILVDGLDECSQDKRAQMRVVDTLVSGLLRIPRQSHKLFITSRPEYHILSIFKAYDKNLVRELELNDGWDPGDDIRKYLTTGFAQIRRSHFFFEANPAHVKWPDSADIDELVRRASGQFIYASVVLKYVQTEEHYSPPARLTVILELSHQEDQPYAELDALYEYLFSQVRVEVATKALVVLSLARIHSESTFGISLSSLLSDFMGTSINEIQFWLRPFASVLVWEKHHIRFLHASLPDFLSTHSRSNEFSIHSVSVSTAILCQAFVNLENEAMLTNHNLLPILFMLPSYFLAKVPRGSKVQLLTVISKFDIVGHVLRKISADFIKHDTARALAAYLEWILFESDNDTPPGSRVALEKPLVQIQNWLKSNLSYQGFSAPFDSGDSMDLWPFFALFPENSAVLSAGSKKETSRVISGALDICAPSSSPVNALQKNNIIARLTNETQLLCSLIPYLTQWRGRADLLESYALTPQRYASAFLQTAHSILRLPRSALAQIITVDRLRGFAPITQSDSSMRFERKAFSHLVRLLSPDIDMYFFVLYLSTVLSDLNSATSRSATRNSIQELWTSDRFSDTDKTSTRPEPWGVPLWTITTSVNYYLKTTRTHFPVLNDPTSSVYTQAARNATSKWIQIGSFHGPPLP